MFKQTHTPRGFARHEFHDLDGTAAVIQESSTGMCSALRIGPAKLECKILQPIENPTTPQRGEWVPVDLPDGALDNSRLHLSQAQVAAMLPTLQYFARNGRLPAPTFTTGAAPTNEV